MRPLRSALCGALVVLGPEKLVKNCENNATNVMPAIASEILHCFRFGSRSDFIMEISG